MICIIDYGVGNLFSLKSSLAHSGAGSEGQRGHRRHPRR